MTDKTSTQLAEFVSADSNVTVGKNNTPGVKVDYKRLDGDEPGKAQSVTYIKGKIPEESRQLLSKLKTGDKFVVVKVKKENEVYFNLSEFKDASTWVAPPPKKPWTGGGKSYEKKEYDQTGVKVGAARNQAIAFLAATKGTKFTLDDVDSVAYEIVKRQQTQEDAVRVGINKHQAQDDIIRQQQEEQLANEQHNRDLDDDIDF